MCAIIGVFGRQDSCELVLKGLEIQKNRGKDGCGITNGEKSEFSKSVNELKPIKSKNCIGHCLHSIVDFVAQPIKNKFVCNSEIYNWKELCKKYNIDAKNDSELLYLLLEKYLQKGLDKIKDVLDELDGVYAFAYWKDNKVILARDILGVKPIWYSFSNGFCFASEKKALPDFDFVEELNPRQILIYNLKEISHRFIERNFLSITPINKESPEKIIKDVNELLQNAVLKRIPDKKFGILFSGGIDSTIIALLCKKLKLDFTCFTACLKDSNLKEPEDLIFAQKAAKELGIRLKIKKITLEEVEKTLPKLVALIEDNNVVKVGVALTFYFACELAEKDGVKVLFSGLGSEEIFAGYERHKKSIDVNKECLQGLLKMYERDLYRDDVVCMNYSIELRLPFLDKKLVDYALKIPVKLKLNENENKIILRLIAKEHGMLKEFYSRKKKAAQYGSNFDKALSKLAKKNKFKFKSDYLKGFYKLPNLKLGVLFSSGKDSAYALYKMKNQNYEISCLICLKSDNPDSYMFHTPNVWLVSLQAEAMGIPLIEQITKGDKEKELEELKKALVLAKDKYGIQGVVTGALYSNYQRERIEKVCDSLGLKIFSPLWHMDQEIEIREIIDLGFEVILSSIAGEGLDESWLGRVLDNSDVDKLVELNKKNGINIAGEGGEFESLVLYAPFFSKKIKIIKKIIVAESPNCAKLFIEDAVLCDKDA